MTHNNVQPAFLDMRFNNATDETDNSFRRNTKRSGNKPAISFVIPVMNEVKTLAPLVDGIMHNVDVGAQIEIILIDDGSTDDSWTVIQALADIFPAKVRGLRFRSNRGKAAVLQAGFDAAEGDIIFTMDADLQDDPREIPRFLRKIEEGYDLVSGWKAVRHDPWHKVLPSRIFNRMLSYFGAVKLHDHNCGFKCYRAEVARSIRLFGELHRMVPSLAGMQGFKVTEIVVTHHPRKFGVSKYGIERFIRGFSDMLTIGFLRVYRERPSHFTNMWAVGYMALAAALLLTGVVYGLNSVHGALFLLGGLCFGGMAGACVLTGLLSELLIRQNSQATSAVVADTAILHHRTRVDSNDEAVDLDSHQRAELIAI